MNIYSSKRLRVASRHSPRFPLEQKRREHVQEALVKETGWNDRVAGPEQRGVLSVGRDVCYTTVSCTQLYREGISPYSWEETNLATHGLHIPAVTLTDSHRLFQGCISKLRLSGLWLFW